MQSLKLSIQRLSAGGFAALTLSACGGSLPLPLPGVDHYALPVKLSQNLECGNGSSLIYEINAKGEFKFLGSEVPAKPVFITRQLTKAEIADFDKLIEAADLDKLQQDSPKISPSAPQTTECRTVDTLTLHHGNKDEAYERNGRKFNYTQTYLDAWARIRSKLDALKDKYAPTPQGNGMGTPIASYVYSLPLKLDVKAVCQMGDYTRYEITAEGRFRYAEAMPELDQAAPAFKERKLSELEQKGLLDLLTQLDLARKAVEDVPIPVDAPQTAECRSVNFLSLQVNGESRSFDQNGRTASHSQAYRDAFESLIQRLHTLQESAQPDVQFSYALPLKVRLDGECGLPDYTRFNLSTEGDFTWTREDWPTLAAGNPPTQNRRLSQDEIAQVVTKLNELKLLEGLEASEPVPADAPQTKECRTVTVYDLTFDGTSRSLEGEGTRKYRHSKELLAKLAELQTFLYELSGQKAPESISSAT